MRYLYLLIVLSLCYSCNNPQANKSVLARQQWNSLNDSALNLMLEFTRSNDTALVEKALLINNEMMVIDTDRKKEFSNLYLRAQILYYLGRYKENFELTGLIQNKYGSDIDKMIHKGIAYKIEGKNDSAQYCLNIALDQCNNIIADSIAIAYQIADIYVIMDKKNELKKVIKELSITYPEKAYDLSMVLESIDNTEKNLALIFESYKKE